MNHIVPGDLVEMAIHVSLYRVFDYTGVLKGNQDVKSRSIGIAIAVIPHRDDDSAAPAVMSVFPEIVGWQWEGRVCNVPG